MAEQEGMVALEADGSPVKDDDFDELSAALSGKEIPGDEFTGEEAGEKEDGKGEGSEEGEAGKEKPDKTDEEKAAAAAAEAGEKKDESEEGKETPEKVDAGEKPSYDELRSMLRKQDRTLAVMQAQIDRLTKRPVAKHAEEEEEEDVIPDGKKKETPEEELSNLELYQNELTQIGESKKEFFDSLLANMALNPNYADVEEVCTQQRFEDIFEAAAETVMEETGVSAAEAALQVELHVWKRPNPYAYMYDIIKKHHPDYKESASEEGKEKHTEKKEDPKEDKTEEGKEGKEKKPADTPLSALDLARGGGGKSQGEWTADKIDNLPESELSKVPKDVYEKYLAGDLDK